MTEVTGQGEYRSTSDVRRGSIRLLSKPDQDLPITFCRLDGVRIFEGDIVVPPPLAFAAVGADQTRRWPERRFFYEIDPGLPEPGRVKTAIENWEAVTSIRFLPRSSEPNFVVFTGGSGSMSPVGMQGGRQLITLDAQSGPGTAMHEIGHAMGLWHEQSREDRNLFITLKWDNIDPKAFFNFDQHIADGDDIGAYDYGSIMHYSPKAFARNPEKPTIVPKNPLPHGVTLGQRIAPSLGDIAAIQSMYAAA